jgi:hypothetical protein
VSKLHCQLQCQQQQQLISQPIHTSFLNPYLTCIVQATQICRAWPSTWRMISSPQIHQPLATSRCATCYMCFSLSTHPYNTIYFCMLYTPKMCLNATCNANTPQWGVPIWQGLQLNAFGVRLCQCTINPIPIPTFTAICETLHFRRAPLHCSLCMITMCTNNNVSNAKHSI